MSTVQHNFAALMSSHYEFVPRKQSAAGNFAAGLPGAGTCRRSRLVGSHRRTMLSALRDLHGSLLPFWRYMVQLSVILSEKSTVLNCTKHNWHLILQSIRSTINFPLTVWPAFVHCCVALLLSWNSYLKVNIQTTCTQNYKYLKHPYVVYLLRAL
jgi:hypothetical protein